MSAEALCVAQFSFLPYFVSVWVFNGAVGMLLSVVRGGEQGSRLSADGRGWMR